MRKEGWESVLVDYIEASRTLSFVWGKSDCALWVAKYFDAVTGNSFFDHNNGKYSDEAGANEFLKEAGFENILEVPGMYLQEKPVSFANRGDIIAFNGALGICDGRRSYILTAERGLFAIPTSACQKAWAV